MSDVLTPEQLAEKLDVTSETVMEWRRAFDWPHVRIGRKIRFTAEQVEQIIARHSVKPKKQVAATPVKIAGQTANSAARKRSA